MVAPPTTLFPVAESCVLYGRESAPATVATTFVTIPVPAFEPEDLATWVHDVSLRGSMVMDYDNIQGPIWAEHTIPTSPVYLDTIPHLLWNLFGDYVAAGTSAAPSTTLTANSSVGATTLTVAAAASFTNGMWIQIDTGLLSEIVQVLSGVSTTITLQASTPTRFSHLSTVTVTNTTGPYTHQFTELNTGGTTGQINGQPPTGTFIHRSQIPGSANHLAVQYLYGCMSEITITGNAMGALTWSGKALSYDHAYPSVTPTVAPSAIRAQPAWRSIVGGPTVATPAGGPASGGTLSNQIAEWEVTFTRSLEEYSTNIGQQAPYAFGRGPVSGALKLTYSPTIDEIPLLTMLNNAIPQLQFLLTNGLAGTSLLGMTIDAQAGSYEKAKVSAARNMFGYDVTGILIGNTTNVGNSGGYANGKVTVQNQVPYF
jgi:hypothetical protein